MKQAIDLGGGIGRVTKSVLRYPFEKIDILDQVPELISVAKKECPFVRNFIC